MLHELPLRKVIRLLFKWLAGLGVAAALLVFWFTSSALPDDPVPGSATARRLYQGFYPVGRETMHLVDRSRHTRANGPEYNGSPKRRLNGFYWYPQVENLAVAPGRHPLVVYSHGFASTDQEGADLASYLASQGYIVVAVEYPLTGLNAPGGPLVMDVVNQPGDISFIIDRMLAKNADPGDPLFERIDPQRIGLVGTSLGGLTTTLAAFHPRWRDPRIAAAVSLAGPMEIFTPRFFGARKLPFMMVAADQDAIIPYPANAAAVPDKIQGSWLVTIKGGSHTGFASQARALRFLANPDLVGCWLVERNLVAQQPDDDGWLQLIGDPDQGVVQGNRIGECPQPLPKAINPVRQLQLTLLAVGAFLDMYFADTSLERQAAAHFLGSELALENPEIVVTTGDDGSPAATRQP